LARGLAQAGATVVLNGRDPQRLAAATATLAAAGLTVHQRAFDSADAVAVQEAVASIEARIGAIDILIDNAGIALRGLVHEIPASTAGLTAAELQTPLAVTRALAAPFELHEMLGAVAAAARTVLHAERVSVWLLTSTLAVNRLGPPVRWRFSVRTALRPIKPSYTMPTVLRIRAMPQGIAVFRAEAETPRPSAGMNSPQNRSCPASALPSRRIMADSAASDCDSKVEWNDPGDRS